ncbi:uncharacterized protein METZ01_LOCUS218903, partial [marine metagenome]
VSDATERFDLKPVDTAMAQTDAVYVKRFRYDHVR